MLIEVGNLIDGENNIDVCMLTESLYLRGKDIVEEMAREGESGYSIEHEIVNYLAEIRFLCNKQSISAVPQRKREVVFDLEKYRDYIISQGVESYVYIEPKGINIELVYENGFLQSKRYIGSNGMLYVVGEELEEMFEGYIEGISMYHKVVLKGCVVCNPDMWRKEESILDITKNINECNLDKLHFLVIDCIISTEGIKSMVSRLSFVGSNTRYDVIECWELENPNEGDIICDMKIFSNDIGDIYKEGECGYTSTSLVWVCNNIIYKEQLTNWSERQFKVSNIDWKYSSGCYYPVVIMDKPAVIGDKYMSSIILHEPSYLWYYDVQVGGSIKYIYSNILGIILVHENKPQIHEAVEKYLKGVIR